jgi:alpha-mannosidase
VMNNYWHTNYKADQGGNCSYHYVLKPHDVFDASDAEKTAFDVSQPLIGFQTSRDATGNSLFELTNRKVLVTSITPATGHSFIVRLFNPDTSTQETRFKFGSIKGLSVTNVHSEGTIKENRITLPPMAVIEVRIVY